MQPERRRSLGGLRPGRYNRDTAVLLFYSHILNNPSYGVVNNFVTRFLFPPILINPDLFCGSATPYFFFFENPAGGAAVFIEGRSSSYSYRRSSRANTDKQKKERKGSKRKQLKTSLAGLLVTRIIVT